MVVIPSARALMADRIIPRRAVVQRTSLSAPTLWRMAKAGTFPAPVRIGSRLGWSLQAVEAWLADRANDNTSREAERVILRTDTVCERIGVSRMTLWRFTRSGDFPKAIQLSANRVGWDEAAVDAWIASRVVDVTGANDNGADDDR